MRDGPSRQATRSIQCAVEHKPRLPPRRAAKSVPVRPRIAGAVPRASALEISTHACPFFARRADMQDAVRDTLTPVTRRAHEEESKDLAHAGDDLVSD